ncbi:BadF/BadG/BcrA/BcrD ATPase family protein [Microbacterium sp. W4I4]|uniref:BadF/BadG/BcrA/BcrD ATPase family protein n=1 Tax=Microbacterium sp. W4I4 TaxID=3042295 RepID=UPI0027D7BE0B|nr:BadF/BadG/BcrA/BcrD ATPase family protein [Microbacterium sp. W4I4]
MDVFVDVGKSGTRLHVVAGGVVRTFLGEGISPTQRGDHGRVLGSIIAKLLVQASARSTENLLVGSTSELSPTEHRSLVAQVRAVLPTARIAVADDGTLAHARLFNAPGVLLAAGTGVIVIGRSASGELRRFDGWGPLAGDRGSAADVGRSALRAAYLAADEQRDSPLRDGVARLLGGTDLVTARSILMDAQWPATLAGLANLVGDLALEGSAEASEILDAAAAALMGTVRTAAERTGVKDLLVTGRFGTAPAIRLRLATHAEAQGIRIVPALPATAVSATEILAGPYQVNMTIADDRDLSKLEGGS